MTQSEVVEQNQRQIPTANATVIGKDPCLYPLALPGQKGACTFEMQKCHNLLLLQNYLASRYLLENNVGNGFVSQRETSAAIPRVPAKQIQEPTSEDPVKPKSKYAKQHLSFYEREDDPKLAQKRRMTTKKTRPSQQECEEEDPSRVKRQKTSISVQDQVQKQGVPRSETILSSPATVTPQRKASNDPTDFVSPNLPLPRGIDTTLWIFRIRV